MSSYTLAKTLLSEVEKERIVCTYLAMADPNANVDWDKAAAEFGSASVESYKKGVANTAKKLKKAVDDGVEPGVAVTSGKNKGGKKRKAKEGDGEGEEAPKKKGRKGKKTAVKVEEGEEGVEEDD